MVGPILKNMPERRFEIGQKVMAKWPKSQLYFRGEIIDFNDIEYLIQFEDENDSELTVKYKDVMLPFKRSRSRSLGRSPPIKSKSPSRRSPSRRSPGRSPSRKSITTTVSSRSPGRKPVIKESVKDSSPEANASKISRKETHEETYVKVIRRDSSPELKNRTHASLNTSVRQSPRIAGFEKKASSSETQTKSNSNSIKVDAQFIAKSLHEKNLFLEFAKRALLCLWATSKSLALGLLVFALPFAVTLLCTSKKCELQVPEIPKKFSAYYDQKAFLIASGFAVSTLALSLIPLGRVVKTKTGARVRCNGFLCLIASAITIGVLLYIKFNITSVYYLLRHMMVSFASLGIVLSLLLYIKSFYARRDSFNPAGKTGYYVVDWIEGGEFCPRVGSFDIKFFVIRLSILSTLYICFLIVGKDLQTNPGKYSIPLLISVGMKVFYLMDVLLFEDALLTTFEYSSVGCGFVTCVGALASLPLLFTVDNRYVLNHGPDMPWYCLVGIVLLYTVGYIILRGSNSQKHAFRTNPAAPALAYLESLPTSSGKRLLVSGWWGFVRHPNYLGDIMVQLAMTLSCGFHHAIPWLVLALSVVYLLGRTWSVESACKAKYGLAWSSYTSRVPYRLVPKIF